MHPGMVSVIIPVHNGERFLRETLESVLAQDYPCQEIILVDDGSTDGTRQVAGLFGQQVKYVYQAWAGVSEARNHGFRLAQGEYILFFDADDLMLPGKLTRQTAVLQAHPHIDYVHSGWQKIDANGKVLSILLPWYYAPTLDLQTWIRHWPIFLDAILFRRSCVERAGEFDSSLAQAEDAEFLQRVALVGCTGTWLKQITVGYRQHEHSTTRKILEAVESHTRVVDRFFSHDDLPTEVRQLEREVRFNSLLYCAYRLYEYGPMEQVEQYLRRSRAFSDYPKAMLVILWLREMLTHRRGLVVRPLEDLHLLYPSFKSAIQVDDQEWLRMERILEHLLQVEIEKARQKSAAQADRKGDHDRS